MTVGLAILFFDMLVGTERIEHAQLETLAVEQQVLMLRVDINEAFAQLLQYTQRHGSVIDEGAALARSSDLAAHDTLVVVLNVILIEERLQVIARHIESSLDDTFRRTGTYSGRLGTLSGEQTDGSKQDRLTGTGLTRDHGKAFRQVKVKRLYERVVLDMQIT